ncbi:hypothetical protein Tco_0722802 [Tanacetum coccineum]
MQGARERNNEAGGQGGAPAARECTFSGFMKCNPTVFHGHEGAVELSRWFEKTEMVFRISECTKARKVKFAAATLQGRALTWWNSQVAMMEVPTKGATNMDLKVKEFDINCLHQAFHEMVQLCPSWLLSYANNVWKGIGHLWQEIVKGKAIRLRVLANAETYRDVL